MNETNKVQHEMKSVFKEHNDNTSDANNKYSLDNPPDEIDVFEIRYLLSIPDDVFQHHFLQYLLIKDIGQLDSAITNGNHRSQYLKKIANSILGNERLRYYIVDTDRSSLLWLKNKKLYLTNMSLCRVIDMHEVFRHCEVLEFTFTMNHTYSANILLSLIISQCGKLKSLKLKIEDYYSEILVDNFSKYCTGLHSLDLCDFKNITDEGIISISRNCTGLQSLDLGECTNITDESIISISKNCTRLQSLNLNWCSSITAKSVISIFKSCTGLKSLDLSGCINITDVAIMELARCCNRLKRLEMHCCSITDEAIVYLSKHCKDLEYLDLRGCLNISQIPHKTYSYPSDMIELQEVIASL